jgi:hypothetical protein
MSRLVTRYPTLLKDHIRIHISYLLAELEDWMALVGMVVARGPVIFPAEETK